MHKTLIHLWLLAFSLLRVHVPILLCSVLLLSLFIDCTCFQWLCVCVWMCSWVVCSIAELEMARLLIHRILFVILFAGLCSSSTFPMIPPIRLLFFYVILQNSRLFFFTKRDSRFTILRLDKRRKKKRNERKSERENWSEDVQTFVGFD